MRPRRKQGTTTRRTPDRLLADHLARLRALEADPMIWEDIGGDGNGSDTAGNYPLIILGLPDLRGYWRLGDGDEPYADTSGYSSTHQADMSFAGGPAGAAVTEHVTPGLLPTEHDDGAVGFNEEGSAVEPQCWHLEAGDSTARAFFNFDASHPTMSVVARVKPFSSAVAFWGVVVSNYSDTTNGGWALWIHYPDGEIQFFRKHPSGAAVTATSLALVTAGEAHTIGATYDGDTQRVYHNGVLVASVADTIDLQTVSEGGAYVPKIGGNDLNPGGGFWSPFYGVIDEVAIYGEVLTDDDMADLHAAAEG